MAKKPLMPAVPRDAGEATYSELVPIKSKNINIWKSPVLYLGLGLAVMFFLMSSTMFSVLDGVLKGQVQMTDLIWYGLLATTMVSLPTFALAYVYMRPGKPFWFYLLPVPILAYILTTPLYFTLVLPFRNGITDPMTQSSSVFTQFIGMFFAAGMAEEIYKAIPTLICAFLAFRIIDGKAKANINSLWPLRGPLDGIMLTMAGGLAFIIGETGVGYFMNQISQSAQATGGDLGFGLAHGLMLLLIRTVSTLSGHMAYSAIFGYAIGLAVIRPKQRWKIMGIGLLVACLIHAIWNSFAGALGEMGYLAWAMASAIAAVAVILKARHIDMQDNPDGFETHGSIVVGKDAPRPIPGPAAGAAPVAAAAAPRPAAPPQTAQVAEKPVMLTVEGISFPLRAGENLGFADDPRLADKAAGVQASVVAHPSKPNVVGLRNGGQSAWTARLRDGSKQVIEHGQNIRLAPTVQVDFGNGLVGTVVEVG